MFFFFPFVLVSIYLLGTNQVVMHAEYSEVLDVAFLVSFPQ